VIVHQSLETPTPPFQVQKSYLFAHFRQISKSSNRFLDICRKIQAELLNAVRKESSREMVTLGITRKHTYVSPFILCLTLLISLILSSCNEDQPSAQTATVKNAASQITYSTKAQDVVIRTYYGGGHYGTLPLGPQLSLYGDGTYVIGLENQGKLTNDAMEKLLFTLVDTDGLLSFKRQQFSDVPDQNSTFLEVNLNGKHTELVYSNFGSRPESSQDLDEYQRLGKALTTLKESLNGMTQPYSTNKYVLLVHETATPDRTQAIQTFDLPDFTLAQAAQFECGPNKDESPTSGNPIGPCLQYTRPLGALILKDDQLQEVKTLLGGQQEGQLVQLGLYYDVRLRPLLPDELSSKKLAMLGSSQSTYQDIPLVEGKPPQQ
jgi:hypothetical protein